MDTDNRSSIGSDNGSDRNSLSVSNSSGNSSSSSKKRCSKRSKLSRASSIHHSTPPQKRAIECKIEFNFKNYWGNISSFCNRYSDSESSCLLQYCKNDTSLLHDVAKAKAHDISLRTKKEHYDAVQNHLSTLGTIKNSSQGHTDYKIQVGQGVQVPCCRDCYTRLNFTSKRLLEKCKKINKEGNGSDINKRKERVDQDGPITEMSGVEFRSTLVRGSTKSPEYLQHFLPYAFCPKGEDKELALHWMSTYFYLYGDQQPNSDVSYMSESFKKGTYLQYKDELERKGLTPISQDSFYRMWISCFPYVLLREECSTVGKCRPCAGSAQLRASKKGVLEQAGRDTHMFH